MFNRRKKWLQLTDLCKGESLFFSSSSSSMHDTVTIQRLSGLDGRNWFNIFLWDRSAISKITFLWLWRRKLKQNQKRGKRIPLHVSQNTTSQVPFFCENWRVKPGETNPTWHSNCCLKYIISTSFNLSENAYWLCLPQWRFFYFYHCFLIQYCVMTSITACT